MVDAYEQYTDSDKSEAARATARTSITDKCDAKNDMFYAWSDRSSHFDWMPKYLKEDMVTKMKELGFVRPKESSKQISGGSVSLGTSKKSGGAKRHVRRRRTRRRKRLQQHL